MSLAFKQQLITQEHLSQFLTENGNTWDSCVFYKVDFTATDIEWEAISCEDTSFIACVFSWDAPLSPLLSRGVLILPKLPPMPFDPYHLTLYSPENLLMPSKEDGGETIDAQIYRHYKEHKNAPLGLLNFLAQWLHDYCIQVSLEKFLKTDSPHPRKVVGIMGGHSRWRTNPEYHQVAEIARSLARAGYCVASGGGPGAMEAANLGAWLAPYPDEALNHALSLLSVAPQFSDTGYAEAAWQVKQTYPKGKESLSLPTWFYGHEPSNIFATHIAKYFSNSIREDGLLAIANYGVIFTPGKAGTVQEVFMDATQNHYGVFHYVSPMIFLGKEFFIEESGIYRVLDWLSQGRQYRDLLMVTDSSEEVIAAVNRYQLTVYAEQ